MSAKHCHSSWCFGLLSTRCVTTLAAAALRPSRGMRGRCPVLGISSPQMVSRKSTKCSRDHPDSSVTSPTAPLPHR
eukprot:861953-Pyramimonas_sp.AAC.1